MENLRRRDFRLMIAVITGQIEEAKHLIDSGANVNCADSQGITPILMAVAYDQPQIAQILVSKGADLSVSTNQGQNVIDYAWAFNRYWLTDLKLESPAKDLLLSHQASMR